LRTKYFCLQKIADKKIFYQKNLIKFIILKDLSLTHFYKNNFNKFIFRLVFDALRDDGVLSSQAESIWLHLPLITKLVECVQKIFPSVAYASSSVPTYPSGCIGYLIAGKQVKVNFFYFGNFPSCGLTR